MIKSAQKERAPVSGYTGLLIDCSEDGLLLYPQSCVKVHSGLAAAGVGFPANVPL